MIDIRAKRGDGDRQRPKQIFEGTRGNDTKSWRKRKYIPTQFGSRFTTAGPERIKTSADFLTPTRKPSQEND